MQSPKSVYDQVIQLTRNLSLTERLRLLKELAATTTSNEAARATGKVPSLKTLWKKYSRPIGVWNRDDIHARGIFPR